MEADGRESLLLDTARRLVERCPRLTGHCYWAGTSVIALEELGHRGSFDLDLHTRAALQDVRPFLAEVQASFPAEFELVQPPDEMGSAFGGALSVAGGERLPLQVFANFEPVPEEDLTASERVPGLRRVTLRRYLADKVQCVAERLEARDLFDIHAVLRERPDLTKAARRHLAEQDALILAERLTGWSDAAIAEDLRGYPDVDPAGAEEARDLLLRWLREDASVGGAEGEGGP